MLIHFYDPQAFFIVFVGNRLDAGGFSRPGIPEQQAVVRLSARHKGIRIVRQLLLRYLISDEVVQCDMRYVQNRLNMYSRLIMYDAEGFVESELSDTVFLIEFRQCRLHLCRCMILAEFLGKPADARTNPCIVHLALRAARLIVLRQEIFRHMQPICHRAEIIVIKFLENNDVMQHGIIDRALDFSPDLTAAAVAVLVVDQKIRKVTVPQISMEAVISGKLYQPVDTVVKQRSHLIPCAGSPLVLYLLNCRVVVM